MRDIFKKIKLFSFIVVALTISVAFATLNTKQTSSISGSSDSLCSGYINYGNQSAGTVNVTLPALAEFRITIPQSLMATEIRLFAKNVNSDTETLIGRAQPNISTTANSSDWNFTWPTVLWKKTSSEDVSVYLKAKVFTSGESSSCVINSPISYKISSTVTAQPGLNIAVNPVEYSTSVGASNSQELKAIPAATITALSIDNMIKYGIFTWSTANNNIGRISNSTNNFLSNSSVIFNAGTTAGTNAVSVFYSYGGSVSDIKKIPVIIKSVEQSSTTSTTTTPTNSAETTKNETKDDSTISTTGPITTTDLTTTDQLTSSKLEISDTTQSCIESGLNDKNRYAAIKSGESKPTADELSRISNCFATSKYILPTSFSPVDPVKIDKLTTDQNVAVNNLENTTKTTDAGNKETLKITGKATPNSKVFVYIFSDPLVITTTADNDGNWQYTIEDPLVPGKHEVYAVVDKGDGEYKRSDPLAFLISTASASAVNPNGLSLKLGETPTKTPAQSQNSLILYVTGSILAIILALIVLFLVLRSHNKHKLAVINSISGNINQPTATIPMIQAIQPVDTPSISLSENSQSQSTNTIEQKNENADVNHESQ